MTAPLFLAVAEIFELRHYLLRVGVCVPLVWFGANLGLGLASSAGL